MVSSTFGLDLLVDVLDVEGLLGRVLALLLLADHLL